jgi:phenylalanyl-tRNA synthetase beta subunit
LVLFDRYSGPPLAANEVSLAYRLRFQPPESGLAEDELEGAVDRIGIALATELGGRIRGADDQPG